MPGTPLLALLLAFGPPADGAEGPAPDAAPASAEAGPPQADSPPAAVELEASLSEGVEGPSFPTESLQLSDTLKIALDENLDLRAKVIDIEVSEANILSALGAYDLALTAGLSWTLSESTPRGSAFVFSTGSRSVGGYLGLRRQLETGGSIELRFDATRTITSQPVSFFDPTLGSAELAQYNLQPRLTVSHPLLKGMGLKVNRASIERARLAASQSQSAELIAAQDMVRDIISAYWDVLFAQRDLQNKQLAVELAKEQLERTQAQVDAGRLAPVDAKAVEQSLAARESEVLLAENTLLDRSLTLRTLLGQEFAERDVLGVQVATDPTLLEPAPIDTRAEIEKALENNPQVRQLQLALASRRIDELEAANQRLPQLDISGQFSPQGRSVDTTADAQTGTPAQQGSWGEAFRNFVNEDVGRDGLFAEYPVSANLDLTWSIRNSTAKGNHARALAEIRRAELNLKQVRQTVAASVVRATNSMRTAGKRMEVARISVELAEENLAAEQARFEVGRSTNYDVMLRIDELDKARNEELSAQIDYLKAIVQLQALNGEILPSYGLDLAGTAGATRR